MFLCTLRNAEELSALRKFSLSVPVAQQSVIADLHELIGKYVQEKATNELEGVEGHEPGLAFLCRVTYPKGDIVCSYPYDSVVRDGHTVGVAAEVLDDMGCASERFLAVDNPLFAIKIGQVLPKGRLFLEGLDLAGESQFGCFVGFFEIVEKLSSKKPGKNLDWHEVVLSRRNPSPPIEGKSAACHDAVKMRMIDQALRPGVQDGDAADLSPQVTVIAGKFRDGLGSGLEEDAIDCLLVPEGERPKLFGNGKDGVHVGHGEHIFSPRLQPLLPF